MKAWHPMATRTHPPSCLGSRSTTRHPPPNQARSPAPPPNHPVARSEGLSCPDPIRPEARNVNGHQLHGTKTPKTISSCRQRRTRQIQTLSSQTLREMKMTYASRWPLTPILRRVALLWHDNTIRMGKRSSSRRANPRKAEHRAITSTPAVPTPHHASLRRITKPIGSHPPRTHPEIPVIHRNQAVHTLHIKRLAASHRTWWRRCGNERITA